MPENESSRHNMLTFIIIDEDYFIITTKISKVVFCLANMKPEYFIILDCFINSVYGYFSTY